jgi:predicted AAA+ superfamily ATPase
MANYIRRFLPRPRQSFFLLGPRGTGKTTWVKYEFPDAYELNLLDEGLYQSYLADITRFSDEMRARPDGDWVFIDEIQRLPDLLNEVHRFIEEKNLQFILTGSSARRLRRSGVNLLAGRALQKFLYPFLPSEVGSAFDLDEVLRFGSLPLIWNSPEKRESLRAYVQMYLREEIKAEALVRNLPGFARFLPVAGVMHARLINLSGASRDAAISRNTLSGYVEILEDTLMAFRVPAFESRLRVRERKHPKLYWIDPGIVRAISNRFGDLHPEEEGAMFEGWVATLLKAHKDYRGLFDEMYYWAPAAARMTEVDFLLQKDRSYLAIETKISRRTSRQDLKGLRAISGLRDLKKRILVYRGDRLMKTEDNIHIWPLNAFLRSLDADELWDHT